MINTSMFREIEYEYPHPDLEIGVKLIVEEALRVAWSHLIQNRSRYGIDLDKCHEKFISEKLQEILEYIIKAECIPGFTCEFFHPFTREEHLRNFNGSSIDKQPDLIFRLIDEKRSAYVDRTYDGIFVECKPIDNDHTTGQTYCAKGIIRFVNGDYAWAMPCSMMIGYVRNSCNIPQHLTSTLKKPEYSYLHTGKFPEKCSESKNNPPVYITEHERNWKYIGGGEPGNIVIRHLWLSVHDII